MERALQGRWAWRVLRNVWTDDLYRDWPSGVPRDAFVARVFLRDGPQCINLAGHDEDRSRSTSAALSCGTFTSSFMSSTMWPV